MMRNVHDEILRQWGRNIADRREALNKAGNLRAADEACMSQEELGKRMDPPVHQSTVARWEAGLTEPRRHYKRQLGTVLCTDLHLLFPITRSVA